MMPVFFDYIFPSALVPAFLYGIYLMQSPRTALRGNRIGALCMFVAVALAFGQYRLFEEPAAWAAMAAGSP